MASETQEPVSEEKKTGSGKKIAPPKSRPSISAVLSSIGMLLFEIVLPGLMAGGVLIWLFGGYNLWQIGRTIALVIFAIVMVVIALLLAVVLDTLTAPLRNSKNIKSVGFARDPRTRLVKLALGGLVMPLLVFGAVNFVPYSTHGTVLNYLIAAAVPPVKLTPPDEVGAISQQSKNPAVKILSIQVLQGFQSTEALNQLVSMVNEDNSALSEPAVADALSKAIASYGVIARDPLLLKFKSIDPKKASDESAASRDLYERYFNQSFESLKNEITLNTIDTAARESQLAQIQTAQSQLKTALTGLRTSPVNPADYDPHLHFIMQVFLSMDLKQDDGLLGFARSTAVDTRYTNLVRGDALLLIGKLGEQKDLDLLYAQLKTSDELLLARTLQAISALQARLAAGGSK